MKLYGPVVYRWARDMGLQPSDAADVAQEVFGALTTHIARFSHERPRDTFRGWLWTITRNRVRDHYRAQQDQARATGGTEAHERLEQLADNPPDPHSESGALELGSVRRRCAALGLPGIRHPHLEGLLADGRRGGSPRRRGRRFGSQCVGRV